MRFTVLDLQICCVLQGTQELLLLIIQALIFCYTKILSPDIRILASCWFVFLARS